MFEVNDRVAHDSYERDENGTVRHDRPKAYLGTVVMLDPWGSGDPYVRWDDTNGTTLVGKRWLRKLT